MPGGCGSPSPPATPASGRPNSRSAAWTARRCRAGTERRFAGRLAAGGRRRDATAPECAGGAALQRVAELLAELAGELVVVETLVLGAGMLDLERAHQVADPADGHPVAALLDAEDQAGAERVAAAGGIGDAALVRRRHVHALARGVDHRPLRALGDDVGLHPLHDLLAAPAGALLQQVGLVVVDGHVVGLLDERAQLLAVEQRHG